MKKKIYFEWGSEKRIKIASAGQEGTFFYEAYRQALAGVAEIVWASAIATSKTKLATFSGSENSVYKYNHDFQLQNDKYLYNYPNNMIVFSGDRGAGKSSAMLSFVSSLQEVDSKLLGKSFLSGMTSCELPGIDYESVSELLRSCQFISIPPIDPTTLESGDQILTVILARMFQLAIDTWDGRDLPRSLEQEQLNKKNVLLEKFSICYEHIRAIKGQDNRSSKYDEGLDVLADLRDGSRLKLELTELVDDLLQFQCLDTSKNPYLIIQIDDTDMNIQHAYSILEDIRKYLVIPRVIIVMAANLPHLKKVVESSLLEGYHSKLDGSSEYANHIAQQYITKLFPQTRQINLPDLGTYFQEHVDSIEICYSILGQAILPEKDRPAQKVQEQIFRLIYKKTGLVFLKDKNQLHYIIPTNMRLHAHFLSMLIQMEDVEDPDIETTKFFLGTSEDNDAIFNHRKMLRTRLQNVLRFRDYFLGTWVTNNLDGKYAELIDELDHIDIAKKVRFVCRHLMDMYNSIMPKKELIECQCSYANMLLLCKLFEQVFADREDSRFIFALHTYFSLLGHSIVLEELVDFYDQHQAPGTSGLQCSFARLYPLYGSRLFPYSDQLKDEDTAYRVKVPIPIRSIEADLMIRWQGQANVAPEDFRLKNIVSLLYSMLADYAPEEHSFMLLLDLCTPITNCLYVYKQDYLEMSPLAKAMRRDSSSENPLEIDDADWTAMRSSALLTVLNWDVQSRIWESLLRRTDPLKQPSTDIQISYTTWPAAVTYFYENLTEPVSNPDNGAASVIAALKKLTFTSWFTSLPFLTDGKDKDKVLDADTWYKVLSKLIPSISRSPKAEASEPGQKEDQDSFPADAQNVTEHQEKILEDGKQIEDTLAESPPSAASTLPDVPKELAGTSALTTPEAKK